MADSGAKDGGKKVYQHRKRKTWQEVQDLIAKSKQVRTTLKQRAGVLKKKETDKVVYEKYKMKVWDGNPLHKPPESFLRKRWQKRKITQARMRAADKAKHKAKKDRKKIFKRAESYVKEYRRKERELIALRRDAKLNNNFFKEPEAKVLAVVRIRGINAIAPKTKKILQLFRLRQVHNCIFLKVNKATMVMLRKVEHYVTYGEPNLKTISDLIYKRGFGKIDKQRIPITKNAIIAKRLNKYDIICMEDLIHEIYTCGPHFKEANNFLWPFKLCAPKGGYTAKRFHFSEGGDAGNRGKEINHFLRKMN